MKLTAHAGVGILLQAAIEATAAMQLYWRKTAAAGLLMLLTHAHIIAPKAGIAEAGLAAIITEEQRTAMILIIAALLCINQMRKKAAPGVRQQAQEAAAAAGAAGGVQGTYLQKQINPEALPAII